MTTQVTTTGITFNDSTVQTTAATASYIRSASPTIPLMDVKTTVGTSTWTIPAGITRVRVTVTGGGAGGSGNYPPGGGGAGGTAIKVFDNVTPGTTMTYTVGAGGQAAQAGSTSSVVYNAVTVSATGGTASGTFVSGARYGSTQYVGNYSGLGGIGQNGDINLAGGAGGVGGNDQNDSVRFGGSGGNSFWGAGGPASVTTGFGTWGQNYGGGGGSNGGDPGGSLGGQGVVVFEY